MIDDGTAHAAAIDVWVCAEPAERSGAVVQEALRRYPGVCDAGARYERDAHGRPSVRGHGNLRISVSHTEGALLVAIAARGRVGVDIERVRERGLVRLRYHALTGPERDELERHAAARQTEVFLNYWTRKEALLKAAGFGLAIDLRLIELPPRRTSPHPTVVPDSLGRPEDWWIVDLDLDGYAAAVAVDAPLPRVRVMPLE